MKAIIFPGQGSQHIGMGQKLYDTFLEAKEVFQEVDEILKRNLTRLIFFGEQEELTRTDNAQPAIMAVSIAAFRVLIKQSGKEINELFKYAAGHSLGEYSAYCATESISLEDTTKLLKVRGESMLHADIERKGAMLALLGCDIESAEKLCKAVEDVGVCQIANDNGADQIVLSGEKNAIDKAIELSPLFNIKKQIKLKVSSAFHSKLMESAMKNMSLALKSANIKKPLVDIVTNLTALPLHNPAEIRDSLTNQITNRVRWRETMDFMRAKDIIQLVEVGPSKVLSGIVKKHLSQMQTINLSTPEEIEAFLIK